MKKMLLLIGLSFFYFCATPAWAEESNEWDEITEATQEDLSCVCYGGPGHYRYPCPPVLKTCHGGPGHYPYPCYVCPQ